MEVSLITGSRSMSGLADFTGHKLAYCRRWGKFPLPQTSVSFGLTTSVRSKVETTARQLKVNAVQSRRVVEKQSTRRSRQITRTKLYVSLPVDALSDGKTLKYAKAISAGMKALKLLGVDGVELPIWWGHVENEAMGQYEWSGYLALAEIAKEMGLELHCSLCFHGCKQEAISLPQWVSNIGEAESNIFFSDRAGTLYRDCLSFSADDLHVLNGKTPLQVYQAFCLNFKASFSHLMGSTITGISMGLGPDGELRYPSRRNSRGITGAGEFQCYDKNFLRLLKQHAEESGSPLWGLGGPHDAPTYDELPTGNSFFKDVGGSWATPYGEFFLSWYSSELISHLDRVLMIGSSVFGNSGVKVAGKLPVLQSWYRTPSHAAEVTAGFYNTNGRDGYERVAQVFGRSSCVMILPGLDLSDEHEPPENRAAPESLIGQVAAACRKHGVEMYGQNSRVSCPAVRLEKMKKNLTGDDAVDLVIYERMGAYFFSPEHFRKFTEFVRSLRQPELDRDDMLAAGDEHGGRSHGHAGENLRLQTA